MTKLIAVGDIVKWLPSEWVLSPDQLYEVLGVSPKTIRLRAPNGYEFDAKITEVHPSPPT